MEVYTFIESINNHNLFKYVGIIIFFLAVFQNRSIGLNIIFAIGLALFAIFYFNDKENKTFEKDEKIYDEKLKSIRPEPHEYTDRRDIVDFLFTIQDLYPYNPQAYEEVIENLTSFFTVYGDVFNGIKNVGYHYDVAESKKRGALNAFHSLIYTLPDDKGLTDKFNRAHKRLDTLLTKYLNDIYDEYNKRNINDGINITKKLINLGPKESNTYTDNQYDFY